MLGLPASHRLRGRILSKVMVLQVPDVRVRIINNSSMPVITLCADHKRVCSHICQLNKTLFRYLSEPFSQLTRDEWIACALGYSALSQYAKDVNDHVLANRLSWLKVSLNFFPSSD